MSEPPASDSNKPSDSLSDSAALLEKRRLRAAKEAPGALATALAVVGLGWMVVVPGLLGIFCGRYLDRRLGTGVQLTAGLALLGLAYGCVLAWSRINHRKPHS